MPTKVLALAAVTVAFLVFAGVAYACGGGCGGSKGGCQAEIGWENANDFPSNPTVTCSVVPHLSSSPAQTLTVTVSKLAPGENCKITASLVNLDGKAVTLKESISLTEYSACHFQYTDNFPSPSLNLGAGKSFPYASTFALLSSGTTSACEGHGGTVQVIIGPSGAW
jgi:5-hydroxyisourate hydrolase-like protein (transthyretin family)